MSADRDFMTAVERMERFAWSRNRNADREPRTITLTDDIAARIREVLDALDALTDDDVATIVQAWKNLTQGTTVPRH